jgi:hypothetical protein
LFQLLNFWDRVQPDARARPGSPLESRAVGPSGQRPGTGDASGSPPLPDTFELARTDPPERPAKAPGGRPSVARVPPLSDELWEHIGFFATKAEVAALSLTSRGMRGSMRAPLKLCRLAAERKRFMRSLAWERCHGTMPPRRVPRELAYQLRLEIWRALLGTQEGYRASCLRRVEGMVNDPDKTVRGRAQATAALLRWELRQHRRGARRF